MAEGKIYNTMYQVMSSQVGTVSNGVVYDTPYAGGLGSSVGSCDSSGYVYSTSYSSRENAVAYVRSGKVYKCDYQNVSDVVGTYRNGYLYSNFGSSIVGSYEGDDEACAGAAFLLGLFD